MAVMVNGCAGAQKKRADRPAIEVRSMSKVFRKPGKRARLFRRRDRLVTALESVSFSVLPGEIFGILGPNGSGKSTLIRVLSTLMIPDAGSARIFGMDVLKQAPEVRRVLSRVSVDAAFYKKLSPRENLLFSARLYGLNPKQAEARALEILERLGVRRSAFSEPLEEMSRGMQQKVAIARAFLSSPVVVLLDEPTTGLDPKSRREVQQFILELRRDHDATIVLTTHDMPEAERLCDRIAFMRRGKFAAAGTSRELRKMVGPNATLDDAFIALSGESREEFDEDLDDRRTN